MSELEKPVIDNFHWRCFLNLEEKLIETGKYVEFNPKNFEAYSIEL